MITIQYIIKPSCIVMMMKFKVHILMHLQIKESFMIKFVEYILTPNHKRKINNYLHEYLNNH